MFAKFIEKTFDRVNCDQLQLKFNILLLILCFYSLTFLERVTRGVLYKICFEKKNPEKHKEKLVPLHNLNMFQRSAYLHFYNKCYHYLFLVTVVLPTFFDASDSIKSATSHLTLVGGSSSAGSLSHREDYQRQTPILIL